MLAYLNDVNKEESDAMLLAKGDVRVRTGNVVEIKGNHVYDLRVWLGGLGF